MRAFVDTNVLPSGLLWHGAPRRLIEEVRAGADPDHQPSAACRIRRPKFQAILDRARTDPEQILNDLRRLAEIVEPSGLAQRP